MLEAFNEVCSKNTNIKLTITGKGSERHTKKISELIKKSKYKHNIRFLGYVNDETYLQELANSDILCMTRTNSPYANAGFPFKLGEYLATGIPVIATKVGDIPKFLTHNKNAFLAEPESVQNIANSILNIINNYDYAFEIGLKGREVIKENFDAENHCKKLGLIINFIE